MIKKIIIVVSLLLLSVYPIYRNYYYGRAILQYERHIDFLEVNSRFHNPWQYRAFVPLTAEFFKQAYDRTIDRILPVDKYLSFKLPESASPKKSTQEFFQALQNPDFIKYNIVYVLYRLLVNVTIFVLLYRLLRNFIENEWLSYMGLIFTAMAMGNAVNESDLTIHTYLDNVLYLLAALIILNKKSGWYIVLLTAIGATNRETCLLIPFLYLISNIDFKKWHDDQFRLLKFPFPKREVVAVTAVAGLIFIAIFVALRWYYGYEPQTQWKVPAGLPMLKLNFFSAIGIKSYFEMLGMFSVIPFICLYRFYSTSYLLRVWFIFIVPIWFLVHWTFVVAYQSRLFLVPTLIIFLPMFLQIIEIYYSQKKEAGTLKKDDKRSLLI